MSVFTVATVEAEERASAAVRLPQLLLLLPASRVVLHEFLLLWAIQICCRRLTGLSLFAGPQIRLSCFVLCTFYQPAHAASSVSVYGRIPCLALLSAIGPSAGKHARLSYTREKKKRTRGRLTTCASGLGLFRFILVCTSGSNRVLSVKPQHSKLRHLHSSH